MHVKAKVYSIKMIYKFANNIKSLFLISVENHLFKDPLTFTDKCGLNNPVDHFKFKCAVFYPTDGHCAKLSFEKN